MYEKISKISKEGDKITPDASKLKELLNMSDKEFDYISKWIEDVSLFVFLVTNADSLASRSASILTLVKLRFGDAPIISIDGIEICMDLIDIMFVDEPLPFKEQSLSSFSDSLESLRHVVDNYNTLREKTLFKKCYKVIGYLMSLTLCKENNIPFNNKLFVSFTNEFTHREWGSDFYISIIDLLLFCMERGLACFKAGSIEPILHDGSTYETWYVSARKAISYSEYLNNPDAHGIFIPQYMNEIDDLIEQGKCIAKYVDKIDRRSLSSILYQLEKVKRDQVGYDAALADRKAPLGILVNGGTSIAKSTFVHSIYVHFGLLMGLPTEPQYKYTRNAVDKHWNNFRTYKWCLVFDDVAFMHESRANEGDPSVMEILQVLNNIAYIPVQASLEDKGKTPCWARLAVFTTNTVHLNAHNYFSCPLAVLRRFPIIVDLEPRDEYRKSGSEQQFIDGAKLPSVQPGEFPDYWKIRVYKPIPSQNDNGDISDDVLGTAADRRLHQRAKFELQEKFTNIYDFMSWLGVQIKHHDMVQNKYMNFTHTLHINKLCDNCHSTTEHCVCCEFCHNNKYDGKCICFQMQSEDNNLVVINRKNVINKAVRDIYELYVPIEEQKSSKLFNILNYPFILLAHFIIYVCSIFPTVGYMFGPFFVELAANILMGASNPNMRKMGYRILGDMVKRKLGFSNKTIIMIQVLTGVLSGGVLLYSMYKLFNRSSRKLNKTHTNNIEEQGLKLSDIYIYVIVMLYQNLHFLWIYGIPLMFHCH